jgi:hypothetical protein
MTTLEIAIPDEQAVALSAKAAAEGMSLEAWLRTVVQRESGEPIQLSEAHDAAQEILALQKRVKPDPDGWTARDYVNVGRR